MKNLLLILLILSTLTVAQTGIGLHTGATTGLSAIYTVNEFNYVDVNLSYNFTKESKVDLYIDYNRHLGIFESPLPLHYGVGIHLKPFHVKDSKGVVAIRGNIGLHSPVFEKFDAFFVLSPEIHLVPDSEINAVFLLGVRYYLWKN